VFDARFLHLMRDSRHGNRLVLALCVGNVCARRGKRVSSEIKRITLQLMRRCDACGNPEIDTLENGYHASSIDKICEDG